MIVDAWYMVSEYKLNLGPSDMLEKTVLYIAETQNFLPSEKENLNNEEIRFRLYRDGQSEEHFTKQLEEIVLPIYESARNMGFSKWVYQL